MKRYDDKSKKSGKKGNHSKSNPNSSDKKKELNNSPAPSKEEKAAIQETQRRTLLGNILKDLEKVEVSEFPDQDTEEKKVEEHDGLGKMQEDIAQPVESIDNKTKFSDDTKEITDAGMLTNFELYKKQRSSSVSGPKKSPASQPSRNHSPGSVTKKEKKDESSDLRESKKELRTNFRLSVDKKSGTLDSAILPKLNSLDPQLSPDSKSASQNFVDVAVILDQKTESPQSPHFKNPQTNLVNLEDNRVSVDQIKPFSSEREEIPLTENNTVLQDENMFRHDDVSSEKLAGGNTVSEQEKESPQFPHLETHFNNEVASEIRISFDNLPTGVNKKSSVDQVDASIKNSTHTQDEKSNSTELAVSKRKSQKIKQPRMNHYFDASKAQTVNPYWQGENIQFSPTLSERFMKLVPEGVVFSIQAMMKQGPLNIRFIDNKTVSFDSTHSSLNVNLNQIQKHVHTLSVEMEKTETEKENPQKINPQQSEFMRARRSVLKAGSHGSPSPEEKNVGNNIQPIFDSIPTNFVQSRVEQITQQEQQRRSSGPRGPVDLSGVTRGSVQSLIQEKEQAQRKVEQGRRDSLTQRPTPLNSDQNKHPAAFLDEKLIIETDLFDKDKKDSPGSMVQYSSDSSSFPKVTDFAEMMLPQQEKISSNEGQRDQFLDKQEQDRAVEFDDEENEERNTQPKGYFNPFQTGNETPEHDSDKNEDFFDLEIRKSEYLSPSEIIGFSEQKKVEMASDFVQEKNSDGRIVDYVNATDQIIDEIVEDAFKEVDEHKTDSAQDNSPRVSARKKDTNTPYGLEEISEATEPDNDSNEQRDQDNSFSYSPRAIEPNQENGTHGQEILKSKGSFGDVSDHESENQSLEEDPRTKSGFPRVRYNVPSLEGFNASFDTPNFLTKVQNSDEQKLKVNESFEEEAAGDQESIKSNYVSPREENADGSFVAPQREQERDDNEGFGTPRGLQPGSGSDNVDLKDEKTGAFKKVSPESFVSPSSDKSKPADNIQEEVLSNSAHVEHEESPSNKHSNESQNKNGSFSPRAIDSNPENEQHERNSIEEKDDFVDKRSEISDGQSRSQLPEAKFGSGSKRDSVPMTEFNASESPVSQVGDRRSSSVEHAPLKEQVLVKQNPISFPQKNNLEIKSRYPMRRLESHPLPYVVEQKEKPRLDFLEQMDFKEDGYFDERAMNSGDEPGYQSRFPSPYFPKQMDFKEDGYFDEDVTNSDDEPSYQSGFSSPYFSRKMDFRENDYFDGDDVTNSDDEPSYLNNRLQRRPYSYFPEPAVFRSTNYFDENSVTPYDLRGSNAASGIRSTWRGSSQNGYYNTTALLSQNTIQKRKISEAFQPKIVPKEVIRTPKYSDPKFPETPHKNQVPTHNRASLEDITKKLNFDEERRHSSPVQSAAAQGFFARRNPHPTIRRPSDGLVLQSNASYRAIDDASYAFLASVLITEAILLPLEFWAAAVMATVGILLALNIIVNCWVRDPVLMENTPYALLAVELLAQSVLLPLAVEALAVMAVVGAALAIKVIVDYFNQPSQPSPDLEEHAVKHNHSETTETEDTLSVPEDVVDDEDHDVEHYAARSCPSMMW